MSKLRGSGHYTNFVTKSIGGGDFVKHIRHIIKSPITEHNYMKNTTIKLNNIKLCIKTRCFKALNLNSGCYEALFNDFENPR